MDTLALHLALHGTVVLTVSIAGGLLLYRTILTRTNESQWHLLHAGGTARGVMLIALAGIIRLPTLSLGQLTTSVWLIIFFVWTSTLAMLIAAATGDRGLRLEGSSANKVVFGLYAAGTAAVVPACAVLLYGLLNALQVRT
jgi:hypothetical protein